MDSGRTLIWFSCGVTSAVATKLALVEIPAAEICRMILTGEHPDSDRFAAECARWFGRPITELRSHRYPGHFEVIEGERYINGPSGAKCTAMLKRDVRSRYQRDGDLHIFGFDADEGDRVEDFRERNPALRFRAPLVEAGLTKSNCKDIVARAGIQVPEMYRMGYPNNNCVGCVKGGAGYWNRIRVDFPEVFARMARIERDLGHTVLRRKNIPLYLDELDPSVGRFADDSPGSCGPICETALRLAGLEIEKTNIDTNTHDSQDW